RRRPDRRSRFGTTARPVGTTSASRLAEDHRQTPLASLAGRAPATPPRRADPPRSPPVRRGLTSRLDSASGGRRPDDGGRASRGALRPGPGRTFMSSNHGKTCAREELMKLSVFLMGDRNGTYADMADQVSMAEELGFHGVWLGERHLK